MNKGAEIGYMEVLGKEFLSQVTYVRRRYLVVLSVISLMLFKVGFVPKKITWAGIELSGDQLVSLKTIIAAGIMYFLLMFLTRAALEAFLWFISLILQNECGNNCQPNRMTPEEILLLFKKTKKSIKRKKVKIFAIVLIAGKLLFECIFPIFLGVIAIISS